MPILFAQSVDHPDRSRFMELRQKASDLGTLNEAQEILIRCGAISYCVDQLLRRHQTARDILTAMSLPRPDVLDTLLEEVIAPVWRLFEGIGETPESFIPDESADQA